MIATHDRASDIPRNDFHGTLLWLRSLEIVTGGASDLVRSEIEMKDLFGSYRSPIKA